MSPLSIVFPPIFDVLWKLIIPLFLSITGASYFLMGIKTFRMRLFEVVDNWSDWRSRYFSWLNRLIEYVELRSGRYVASGQTFDWLLRIAYFYPVASFIVIWVLTGASTAGVGALLPDKIPLHERALDFVVLLVATYTYYHTAKIKWLYWWPLAIISVGLVLLSSSIAGSSSAFAVLAGVFCASSVSIIVNIQDVQKHQKSYGVSRVFLAGAVGGAINGAFLFVTGISKYYAEAGLGLFCIASIAFLFSRGGRKARDKRRIGIFVSIQLIMFVLIGFLFAFYSHNILWVKDFTAVYVMWGILPFLNAPFDWLSIIVTFILVKLMINAAGAKLFFGSIIDVIVAAILMMLAMFVILFYLSLLYSIANINGGIVLVNPIEIVAEVERDFTSASVFWLYFMVSTTLFPTIFHLFGAAASSWTAIGHSVLLPISKMLVNRNAEEDVELSHFSASFLFSTILISGITILIFFTLSVLFLCTLLVPYFVKGVGISVEVALRLGSRIAVFLS